MWPGVLCSGSTHIPMNIPVRITTLHACPSSGRDHCGVRVIRTVACTPAFSAVKYMVPSSIKMCLFNTHSLANKDHKLNDFFTSENFCFLFLTETWQCDMEFIHLNELGPVDCSFIGSSRLTGHGGGVAVVWKNNFSCQLVNTESYHF